MYAYFAIDTACLEPQWDWCTFVSTPGVHVVWVLIPRYDKKREVLDLTGFLNLLHVVYRKITHYRTSRKRHQQTHSSQTWCDGSMSRDYVLQVGFYP